MIKYKIVFILHGEIKSTIIEAVSKVEAIGKLLILNSFTCYDNVKSIVEI
jgi:hypothetical protein